MKSTTSDRARLSVFIVSTLVSIAIYILAYYTPENSGTLIVAAISISSSALFTCTSLTTVYLNWVYNNHIIASNKNFIGLTDNLKHHQNEAGNFLYGVILFTIFFSTSLVARSNYLSTITFSIALVFTLLVLINIKRFKDYLRSRSVSRDF